MFVQDNTPIHKSNAVCAFFTKHQINTIEWPPYSPNLNPIEHLWWVLKKRMHKFYSEYNKYSKAEEGWDGFCNAMKECWWHINVNAAMPLCLQMGARLANKILNLYFSRHPKIIKLSCVSVEM
jgi:hypothetical protein